MRAANFRRARYTFGIKEQEKVIYFIAHRIYQNFILFSAIVDIEALQKCFLCVKNVCCA